MTKRKQVVRKSVKTYIRYNANGKAVRKTTKKLYTFKFDETTTRGLTKLAKQNKIPTRTGVIEWLVKTAIDLAK